MTLTLPLTLALPLPLTLALPLALTLTLPLTLSRSNTSLEQLEWVISELGAEI